MDVADVFYDNLWLFISAPPMYHARDHPRTRMVPTFPAFSCAALRRSDFVFGVSISAEAA